MAEKIPSKDVTRDKHSKALHPTTKSKEEYLKKVKEETRLTRIEKAIHELQAEVAFLRRKMARCETED